MKLTANNQLDPDIRTVRVDPNRGYRVWRSDEIYMGGSDQEKYVPNVGDLVHFYEGGKLLIEKIVVSVNEQTLIPTFEEVSRPVKEDKNLHLLKGLGPSFQTETWRAFYDNRSNPATIMLDTNYLVFGSEARYMKLFKGRDISSDSGLVISQYRNNTQASPTENIPLYQVIDRFDGSKAIKRPQVFHTTHHLEEGEIVTGVVYTDSGFVSNIETFIITHSSNVRTPDADKKYVAGIELVSPFLSKTENKLVEVPANLTTEGLFTMGKVLYSDGTEQRLAIDGNRFAILGLDGYTSMTDSQTGKFALRYLLASNEAGLNSNTGEHHHITEIYRYRSVFADKSYSCKINVVPRWNASSQSWELRYYLTTLERKWTFDFTEHIQYGRNSDVFNGKLFYVKQHINVALSLDKLGLGLRQYRHVQSFSIILLKPPTNAIDPCFQISYSPSQDVADGTSTLLRIRPVEGNDRQVDIELNHFANAQDFPTFLQKTYLTGYPIFHYETEIEPPVPTHIEIEGLKDEQNNNVKINLQQHWNRPFRVTLHESLTLEDLRDKVFRATWMKTVSGKNQFLSDQAWIVFDLNNNQ